MEYEESLKTKNFEASLNVVIKQTLRALDRSSADITRPLAVWKNKVIRKNLKNLSPLYASRLKRQNAWLYLLVVLYIGQTASSLAPSPAPEPRGRSSNARARSCSLRLLCR